MNVMRVLTIVAVLGAFAVVTGCSDTETTTLVNAVPPTLRVNASAGTTAGPGFGGGGGGTLYVADPNQDAILRYGAGDNGDVAPRGIIVGTSTGLQNPFDLALDAARDKLYVLNVLNETVTVYDNASTLNGNVAPSRVIAFTDVALPVQISLDTARDTLYVGSLAPIGVSAYTSASTANTTLTSARQIAGLNTGIGVPNDIRIDPAGDRLTVVSTAVNRVLQFDLASTLTGDIAPSRVLSGAATGLAGPNTVTFDGAANMYITNNQTADLTVYAQGAVANGNVAPTLVASAANTGLITPQSSIIADGTTLYITDSNAFAIFAYNTTSFTAGNTTPVRVITGGNTLLTAPTGLAHDPFR